MNITELRYLVAIMKWGSVSAAAKQLYAAQPNVSKALKNLEEEYHLRIFERSSTGMIPTEQGRHFIEQAARILEEVDRLDQGVQEEQKRCTELRVMIPHATYASYAAVDLLEQAAGVEQLRIHIREYYLLTNQDGPLASREIHDLSELNQYVEILHDDFQLPGEDGGDGIRWHVNDRRRVHVYERCSQFSILQRIPTAYMWASPMPRRALDQFHLVLKKCPAQHQKMRDVMVYPDKSALRPEERAFIELLHKEAAQTVK